MTRETRLAVLLWAVLWPSAAAAAQPQYCMLYAREWMKVFAGQLEPADAATITPEALARVLGQAQSGCILVDEPPDFKPGQIETDDQFLAHLLTALRGKAPAAAEPPPGSVPAEGPTLVTAARDAVICGRRRPTAGAPGSEERRAYCAANFRTFHKDDGTIICRGKRKRSPCA